MDIRKTNSRESIRLGYCRIATILATVLLFFTFILIPDNCYAEDYTDDSGMTFQYTVSGTEDDRYAVITGCDRDTVPEDGIVYVPETIDGYPVREIGTRSLYSLGGMKKVIIPGSVQRIQEKAFFVSEEMKEVVLSEGLVSIEAGAFYETGLQNVSFPESLESIGNEAFSNCGKLREVSIPKGVSTIGTNAFAYCLALESFHVDPDSLYFASPDGILFSADGSTLIKYPVMRTVNGQQPEEYTVPDGTVTIGDNTFQYAKYLKCVSLADSVETIGEAAFEYCDGLLEITLPSAIRTVGSGAFDGCVHITKINIPAGLEYLPSDAFAGCQRIAEYNVAEGNAVFSSERGVLFSADGSTLMKYPSLKADTEYIVPSGVSTISDYAFQKAEMVESIVLENGVKKIGDYAFSECLALRNISLPDSLEYIGSYAFSTTHNLRIIVLPDNLKEIGDHAFFLMAGLTELEIPGTVKEIKDSTFATCFSLERVVFSKGTKRIGPKVFENCTKLSEVTIPDTVETIESDILENTGAALPDGRQIKITGYLGSAAEAFVKEKAEDLNLVFERAVQPVNQAISVRTSLSCIYGSRPFSLGAVAKTPLTYRSSNEKVAVVSSKGIVTLKGVGTAVITVNAREDNYYNEATARVTINVRPGKPALKAKNIRRRKVKIVWSKVEGADGYEIYIKAPGKKTFKKRATKSAKVKSITHSGLKKGKKYSYKVRAFTNVNGKRVYGDFSTVRKVKIKK